MDPLSIAGAIGVATKDSIQLNKDLVIGQDIDQMLGQIGKWMSASF